MKTNVKFILPVICLALTDGMQAAVRYWDANGADPGAGATPTGTWGADSYWSTDTNGAVPTTAWTFADTAVFSAGNDATNPVTVFVSGTQTASSLTFEEGPVTLSGGTIAMWATPFTIAANANATIDSVLAGPQVLTKTGTGTLTLNGTNIYTHETIVSRGALVAGNAHALGTALAGTTISDGATLGVSGGIALRGPLRVYGSGALRSIGGSNWVASILVDQAASQSGSISSEAGVLTLGRVEGRRNYTLNIGGDGDMIISGDDPSYGLMWGGESGTVKKVGSGTMTINGLVTIRERFFVGGGTVRMGASHRFGNYEGVYPDVYVSAVWDLNGFDQVIDCLDGPGTMTNSGTSTLVVGTNGTLTYIYPSPDPVFWGSLSGNTTIKKIGPGRQVLSGSLTYTGDTIIEGGILKLATSCSNSPMIHLAAGASLLTLSSPPLMVGTNQTLMGSGSVTGAVTVATGGRVQPGDGPGTLSISGGLDLSPGGTNVWELAANTENGPGMNFDRIAMMGGAALTLGGNSTLSLKFIGTATAPDGSDPFWQETRTWHMISATNVTSNFAAIENASCPAGNFSTSVDTNGVWLTFTPSVTRPRITSITDAGTASVTVNYANTLPGTNYVLRYNTNLATTNWFTAGAKTASGTSDSQTDSSSINDQRYYRVNYVTP